MDERDRRYRDRDWRRSEDADRRYSGGEGRSFGDDHPEDRVFGQRESGTSYDGRSDRMRPGGGAYGAGGSYGSGEGYRGSYGRERYSGGGQGGVDHGRSWQDKDYGGVSPAMEQGEYQAERRAERYDREHPIDREGGRGRGSGGRYLGDNGRDRIYRQEYGQGGVEYGDVPRGYDAGYRSYGGGQRGFSGGTGGYDYERGYGDAGRSSYGRSYSGDRGWGSREQGGDDDRGQRFEQAGHDAGQFFRRAGERVASWFGGGETERGYDRDRDFRGMGPKGYKRADERISDELHERLTDDPYVDASNISISVSGGEVTLSGTVENREAKHRAERCVEDVSGVSHVQNNLRVDQGSFLTSPGRGYGDSVLDAQMRGETGSGESIDSGVGRAPGTRATTGDGGSASTTSRTSGTDAGKSR
jgi:osmotically-inducible protein OsmY